MTAHLTSRSCPTLLHAAAAFFLLALLAAWAQAAVVGSGAIGGVLIATTGLSLLLGGAMMLAHVVRGRG